jgi:hypothetical protein
VQEVDVIVSVLLGRERGEELRKNGAEEDLWLGSDLFASYGEKYELYILRAAGKKILIYKYLFRLFRNKISIFICLHLFIFRKKNNYTYLCPQNKYKFIFVSVFLIQYIQIKISDWKIFLLMQIKMYRYN